MLRTLSLRTGLLSLLAIMTFLLLVVSGMGIYALSKSSSSLERISVLQGEKMARLNEGYTQILRARNESGQAVRMMEVGLLADAGSAVKIINSEIEQGRKSLDSVIKAGVDDEQGAALLAQVAKSYSVYLDQGIKPMQAALNQQSADAYYDLLENKLVPVSRQFDNDIQAFLSWGENRGKAEVSAVQTSKNFVMMLIVVVALAAAGIIVLAWLALLQCGARVLPLNPQLPPSLLAALLPSLDLRYALVLNGDPLALDFTPLTLQRAAGDSTLPWREERLASMTLTSGSTGLPKAAVHSCRAHLASAEGVLAMIPLASDDDWLLSLPLFHVSGQKNNRWNRRCEAVRMPRWCPLSSGDCLIARLMCR